MRPTATYALKDEFVYYYRILRICKVSNAVFFVNSESFLQFKIPQYSLVASGHHWNYFLFHRVCSYFSKMAGGPRQRDPRAICGPRAMRWRPLP